MTSDDTRMEQSRTTENVQPIMTCLRIGGGLQRLWFWCPGCEDLHCVNVGGEAPIKEPVWDHDGNMDAPTISPSILVNYGNVAGVDRRCHSFLRGGVWEFLSDSTHTLAGQNVPMVPIPAEFGWIYNDNIRTGGDQ